jgi:hypothetical protein
MFNGDRAWKSDKLKALPGGLAAEYAWVYSCALADGTFECDPERVYSDAYSFCRKGWTVGKVEKMLDEFERVGLLLRRKDVNGKVWGYWVGCEQELPSPSEKIKLKIGKGFLFETLEAIESAPTQAQGNIEHGLVRLGKGREGEVRADLPDDRPRGKGEYKASEFTYLGKNLDKIYNIFVEKWQEAVGPGAICKKPFKGYWTFFSDTVNASNLDTLIPAFELWASANANQKNEMPIGDFLPVVGKWTQRVIIPKVFTPKNEDDDPIVKAERAAAIARDIEESKARNKRATESKPVVGETVDDFFAEFEEKA